MSHIEALTLGECARGDLSISHARTQGLDLLSLVDVRIAGGLRASSRLLKCRRWSPISKDRISMDS